MEPIKRFDIPVLDKKISAETMDALLKAIGRSLSARSVCLVKDKSFTKIRVTMTEPVSIKDYSYLLHKGFGFIDGFLAAQK